MTDAEFMLAMCAKEKAGFYFCNKCGYADSEGPDHDKPNSYPKFQCSYRAVLVQHNKGYIAKLNALEALAKIECRGECEPGEIIDKQCARCEALRKFRAAIKGPK